MSNKLVKMVISIKNANLNDLDGILNVEKEAWPEEIRAPKEKFKKRMELFPKGFFVAKTEEKIVGYIISEIIEYAPDKIISSWNKITDNGWMEKTHNPKGNSLYIVSIGVLPKCFGGGIGTKLLRAEKELVKKLNLNYLVLGSRVPNYRKAYEKNKISIKDYVYSKNDNGGYTDPLLRFCAKEGLKLLNDHHIVEGYMPGDKESMEYGVVMIWDNNNYTD